MRRKGHVQGGSVSMRGSVAAVHYSYLAPYKPSPPNKTNKKPTSPTEAYPGTATPPRRRRRSCSRS